MKAYRNKVLSHLLFAALAVVPLALALLTIVLYFGPFAGALRAQSAAGTAPTVLRAMPEGESRAARTEGPGPGSITEGRWMEHRTLVDPSPDVKCAIVDWITASPKPSLVIVCPPEEVFAPLRLYFKLSWMRDVDVPSDFQIIAAPKALIKMHWTMRGDYQVLLQTERKNEHGPHTEWVNFNNLVGVFIKSE
jgi:hypothetical protein